MKKFLNTQKLGCCFLYSGIFVICDIFSGITTSSPVKARALSYSVDQCLVMPLLQGGTKVLLTQNQHT